MTASSCRSSLRSTPLAALMAAALTLWGCGGDGGGGGKGGGGGSVGKGGAGGSAGKGGAGGSTTGTGGSTTGTGGSATGTGGSTTGTGGRGGTGGSATGTAGTGGSATGTAGTGGSTGTAGTGGSTGTGGGGATGTGGTTPSCTNGAACALASVGGTSGTVSGVCVNGACANCAADSTCQTAYGTNHICLGTGAAANCVAGDCHQNSECNGKICSAATNFCTNCAGDGDCVTAFGANHLCQSGSCVAGNCRNNGDCASGQICNASSQCVSCNASDAACVGSYGTGYICVSNSCVMGSCHDNTECGTGKVCSASHVCAACTADGQCGTGKICVGTGAAATCVTGDCHGSNDCSNGRLCVSNSCTDCTADNQCATGQLCLSGGCVTGNCRVASNCTAGLICTNNNCTACTTDGQCVSGYGADHLCNGSGACIVGNCRAAGQCTATSQVCNTSSMLCEGCTGDGQCATEYNNARICISSVCVVGNCHTTTASCTSGGQVCNLASHACEGCTADSQCSDVANYGPNHICQGNACITGNCHAAADCNNAAQVCKTNTCGMCTSNADCTAAYGANHVCSGGACTSGNCNSSSECGNNQLCLSHSCTACSTDAQCVGDTTYGAMHICLGTGSNAQCVPGNCHDTSTDCTTVGQICGLTTPHVCGGCGGSDTACKNDGRYGNTTICLANLCVTGDCHDTSTDCTTAGQICGVSTAHTCGACATDVQCTGDTRYGSGNICYQGNCQVGNCHAISNDCTALNAGRLCGVSTPLVCGACSSDGQCTTDPFYGNTTICNTAAGANQGKCVSKVCNTAATGLNNNACTANTGDFCCSSTCVPGNCCSNTDCANNPLFGAGYACTGNTCSHCDAIASNTYYVDPVNGDDVAATGSGKSGGATVGACSFKTLTRAMQVIGTFAGAGTKVIIVGAGSTPRGLAASEVLPVTVQPNVTVTTTGGPITIVLPAAASQAAPNNTSGFNLTNNGSGVAGDPAAPLILDGNGNTSGFAIAVSGTGTASLSNLTIKNTRAHAINVTGATLNVGAGVVVQNAGIAGQTRNGLNVSGGVVNINVPSGTPTQFTGNTQYGIEVSALGSVNVTGAAIMPPTGNGTVVISQNQGNSGLFIHQTAGATLATNTITGLVVWNNNTDGARFGGGSRIKVRSSVFGANVRYGIVIVQGNGGTTAQQRDMSTIDLGVGGTTPDYGKSYLQTPTSVLGRNQTTGLCITLGGAASGAGVLNAAGNQMVFGGGGGTQVDCSTTVQTVTKGPTCANGASLGIAAGTTVAVTLSQCN